MVRRRAAAQRRVLCPAAAGAVPQLPATALRASPRSRFNPGFYSAAGGSKPGKPAYAGNVRRTACQASTKDDWCNACSGSTCNGCFERPRYGQPSGQHAITLTSGKCLSACPDGTPNCAGCNAKGRCGKCAKGWKKNSSTGACTVQKKRRAA